ncbi:NUDIX hydrolase [Microbacterium sp. R86528]|uniref:NUDIX hydrolase n=1 Tax=Microbacterium sp. R86528 TaxID=3093864 RepID=UPI0037C74C8F
MPQSKRPADSTFAALAATLGDALPRRPEDASDPTTPVAATVVMVRDSDDGPEILLIERPDRGSFAGAWVFPGGKLDSDDHRTDDDAEELPARRAAARETFEETGLIVDPDSLIPLSTWDPPPGLPLRIRTWFFVAHAHQGTVALAADEAVDSEWLRPLEMLERHSNGEVTLYPPTWITLHTLAHHPDVNSLVAATRLAGPQQFETMARLGDDGPIMLWQEDAEYHGDATPEASRARHRITLGALPWVYTREVNER